VSAEKRVNVSDAFVFPEFAVRLKQRAFCVCARDRGVQATQLVTTVSERDLRDQQNAEDDENE